MGEEEKGNEKKKKTETHRENSAPDHYPGTCKFCGKMVHDVIDYIENHLEVHFPVAKSQYNA